LPTWSYFGILFGVGSVIAIPIYAVTQKIYSKRKRNAFSDILSGKETLRLNHIPLQSIYGNSKSNFARLIESTGINSDEKKSFLLECSNIIELRIYSYQTLKLNFRITPKRDIMNRIKPKILEDYRESLLKSSQDFESSINIQLKEHDLKIMKTTSINYIIILLYESEKSNPTTLFKQSIDEILAKLDLNSQFYFGDIQKLTELLSDYLNIAIAYPIDETESLNQLQNEKKMILQEIISKENVSSEIKFEILKDLETMNLALLQEYKDSLKKIENNYEFDIDFSEIGFN